MEQQTWIAEKPMSGIGDPARLRDFSAATLAGPAVYGACTNHTAVRPRGLEGGSTG